MNRVVITGIGVVSPVGNSLADFWQNIKAGTHGFGEITRFDTTHHDVKIAAEVKGFDPLLACDKKELRKTDLYTQYALEATRQAMADCGTDFKEIDPFRVGVLVGSGIGGFTSTVTEHRKYMEKGIGRISPYYIPMMISNMAAGMIAIKTGFCGINYAPVTACATSSHAIGEAFRNIKHGYLDACVTGGAEAALIEFSVASFNNMKALSHSNDKDRASIPFDKQRDGFVMGEGAGILMLEELSHAKARGAHIYAEIVGYGATADAHHITSPHPDGVGCAKAMELAYQEAGVLPEEIGYINAHGTSTPLNEKYETIAIKKALGKHGEKVLVSSTKSMTGHLLGAAGAVEAIVCAKALQEDFVPGNVGLQVKDEDCDLTIVPAGGMATSVEVALSNSLGFGGQNAVLCLKKYK